MHFPSSEKAIAPASLSNPISVISLPSRFFDIAATGYILKSISLDWLNI